MRADRLSHIYCWTTYEEPGSLLAINQNKLVEPLNPVVIQSSSDSPLNPPQLCCLFYEGDSWRAEACEVAETQESLVSFSSIDQVLFFSWSRVQFSGQRERCVQSKCLTLIRLIAATISIRLLGRPTSKLPIYCKTVRWVREFVAPRSARENVCIYDDFYWWQSYCVGPAVWWAE